MTSFQSGIYEIVNALNGKRYVGSAVNFAGRFCVHRNALRSGKHHSKHLQASWIKYGEPAFVFKKLLVCSPSDTIFYEQLAIDALHPEYNVARIAGNCLGVKHSVETRAKRSLLNIGNKFSLGKPKSHKCKMAVAESNRRRKGIKRSLEAVARTAAVHRGMRRSEETREKIAAKAIGRKWSYESRAKLSSALTGRKMSDEFRAKLIGNKRAAGKKPTPEENARRSATLKAAWAAKKAAGIPWR